jgi:hypothetical protein
MSVGISDLSLNDTPRVAPLSTSLKLDNLPPGIIYVIAQHLRAETPLQVKACRCTNQVRKVLSPQAAEGYKISPTDPAWNLSRVCTSLKGILETEVKREFRVSYCSVGVGICAMISGELRESVRYVIDRCFHLRLCLPTTNGCVPWQVA